MKKIHIVIASILISNTALSEDFSDYNRTIKSTDLSIILFDNNQKFSDEATKATKTILKNKECAGVTREIGVFMYTGKSGAVPVTCWCMIYN